MNCTKARRSYYWCLRNPNKRIYWYDIPGCLRPPCPTAAPLAPNDVDNNNNTHTWEACMLSLSRPPCYCRPWIGNLSVCVCVCACLCVYNAGNTVDNMSITRPTAARFASGHTFADSAHKKACVCACVRAPMRRTQSFRSIHTITHTHTYANKQNRTLGSYINVARGRTRVRIKGAP